MYKLVVLFCVALARNSLASVGHAVAPAHLALPAATSYLGAPALRVAAPALATSYAAAPAIATSYAAAPAFTTRYAAAPAVASYAAAPAIASYAAAPAIASYAAAPAIASYAAAPAIASYAAAPAVTSYAAAPAIASYAAAPAIAAAPAVAVAPAARLATPAQIQTTSYALEKNVHYASKPVVTGYSTSVVKPNFGGLATPLHTVSQQSVLAAGRQVQTITPHVTRVEPEVSVHQVPVDVPVPHPVVSEVEVRTPVVQGAPIVAAPAVAAAPVVAAAPATIAAAPIAPAAIAAAPIAPAAVAADLPTIVEARAAWSAQHAPIGARIAPGFRLAHY